MLLLLLTAELIVDALAIWCRPEALTIQAIETVLTASAVKESYLLASQISLFPTKETRESSLAMQAMEAMETVQTTSAVKECRPPVQS